FLALHLPPPALHSFPTRRSSDLTAMHDRRANVIDQLLANQLLAIKDGVEDFADRKRRYRMLANQAKALLHLCRHGIFEPEEMVRDRKSTRLNSSHQIISYAVFCL